MAYRRLYAPRKGSDVPNGPYLDPTESGGGLKAGRDGEIRTHDPLNPIQVRYQAALRPDAVRFPNITEFADRHMDPGQKCCRKNRVVLLNFPDSPVSRLASGFPT